MITQHNQIKSCVSPNVLKLSLLKPSPVLRAAAFKPKPLVLMPRAAVQAKAMNEPGLNPLQRLGQSICRRFEIGTLKHALATGQTHVRFGEYAAFIEHLNQAQRLEVCKFYVDKGLERLPKDLPAYQLNAQSRLALGEYILKKNPALLKPCLLYLMLPQDVRFRFVKTLALKRPQLLFKTYDLYAFQLSASQALEASAIYKDKNAVNWILHKYLNTPSAVHGEGSPEPP